MAEILNIRGLQEAPPANRTQARSTRATEILIQSAESTDEAVFSAEAQAAAEAARLRALAEGPDSELRAEELERVRARIRDGAYRVQETVLQVASRVLPIVDQQI